MPVARSTGGARTGALAAVACVAAVRLALGDGAAGLALDAAAVLAAAAATVEAARRARPGRSRLAWRLETASLLAWLLAPLAWLAHLPPAVASTGRVALVLLAGAAWWLTSRTRDTWSRVRLVVDACLVGASAFVVGWTPLLRHVWSEQAPGVPTAVAIGIPLGAVAVAVVAAGVALTEMRPPGRAMPAWYVAGLLLVGASDLAHALGATPAWAAGFACVVAATRAYRGTSHRSEVLSIRNRLVFGPYLVLAPVVAAMAVQHARGGVPREEVKAIVVIGVLLLVRQHATLAENRNLVARLAATERELRHRAMHDALTGLGGRALLHERLGAAVRRHRQDGVPLAVVFMDLDDFKLVNDTYGHAAGDDVLVEIAHRLRRAIEPLGDGAAAFRMSGDEFAVLLTGPPAEVADATARGLLAAIGAPVQAGDRALRVGGSAGVAVAAGPDTEASALLRAADVAMYGVKHGGKGGFAVAPDG